MKRIRFVLYYICDYAKQIYECCKFSVLVIIQLDFSYILIVFIMVFLYKLVRENIIYAIALQPLKRDGFYKQQHNYIYIHIYISKKITTSIGKTFISSKTKPF